jgi:hypothetical protein
MDEEPVITKTPKASIRSTMLERDPAPEDPVFHNKLEERDDRS